MDGKIGDANVSVTINGVKYAMYPELKWDVQPGDNVIGYAGNMGLAILKVKGDSKMNFIYLRDTLPGRYYYPLCRTDRIIPEPSAKTVDTIYFREYDFSGDEVKSYDNTIADIPTVDEFFSLFNNNNKVPYSELINIKLKDFSIGISCSSNQVPGALCFFDIGSYEGKLVCGDGYGYVEMPIELLEKLAGHKLNINDYI